MLRPIKMAIWAIVTIIILVVVTLSLGVLIFYTNTQKLEPLLQTNMFYQFGGDPAKIGAEGLKMQCPVGRKIVVLDAWYETYDPNNQFWGAQNTSGLYGTDSTGNPSAPVPKTVTKLPNDIDDVHWAFSTTAANLPDNDNKGIYSKICTYDQIEGYSSAGDGECKIGNALPLISGFANGQTTYTMPTVYGGNGVYWYSYLPSPCSGKLPTSSSSISTSSLDYHQSGSTYADDVKFFPIGSPTKSFGEGGGPKDVTSISGQQGYYLHGIYSCVLDEDYPDPADQS